MSAPEGVGGTCFDPPELDRVIAEGFSDPRERARFLAHFGLACRACEEHFRKWALRPGPFSIRASAEEVFVDPLHDPPRRALLRRRFDLRGGFESEARTTAEPLPFLRLVLEEARNASLGLPAAEAVACVRRVHEDLNFLRRFLQREGSPPGCLSPDRLRFLLLAELGLASEAVASELQGHGEHQEAEELRRESETTRFLSGVGQWLDRYLIGQRGV